MKKTMKKLVALATAAVMTFAMGISASAASIVTLAGSMNDWNAADMNAQFKDDDGDGIWTYTTKLAAGDYSFKVILDGAWTPDGMGNNYGITVAADTDVTFYYNQNSTSKYPFAAAGEGVTANVHVNDNDADDPEAIQKDLQAAVDDAASWLPAAPAADEPATDAPAADEPATEAPAGDKQPAPQTGDALSLSIVLIGAVAAVAFVASKKRANN